MTTLEMLTQRYQEARGKAGDLLKRYHEAMDAAKTDEDRSAAAEILTKQERAFKDAERLHGEIERARATNALPQLDIVRTDSALSGGGGPTPRASDFNDEPSPRDLAERHTLAMRALGGDTLSEAEQVRARTPYPVERLFAKRLAVLAGRETFTADEERAWARHQSALQAFDRGDIQNRAYTNVMNLAAGSGAEVIPTILQAMIWPDVYRQGPLADDTLVYTIRLPWEAKTDVALLGGSPRANVVAAGADGSPVKPTTSKQSFSPHKYAMHTPLASELLVGGGYTDIEARVVQWIAKGFGIAYNDDGTNGDGTNKQRGILADAGSTTAASKTAITADEVRGIIVSLGEDWLGRPGTRFMSTLATENAISILRDKDTVGSEKAFPMDLEGRPILPYGVGRPTWNRNLGAIGTGTANVAIVGDFSQYARVHVGGMRFAREYDALSDSYLLAVFQSTDGRLIESSAAHALKLPA